MSFYLRLVCTFLIVFVSSCKSDLVGDDTMSEDEQTMVTVTDFEVGIEEGPEEDQSLGTLQVESDAENLFFEIVSQEPEGALGIDGTSGEISVANPALFIFDENPVVTAVVKVTGGDTSEQGSIIINLMEADTEIIITASDFEITIDENPDVDQLLGTLEVSVNMGSPNFTLVEAAPEGAMSIDSDTGEIFVADSSLFSFEDNPTVTATAEIQVDGVSEQASILINLNEPDVMTIIEVEDFVATITENPEINMILGTIEASTNMGALEFMVMEENPENALNVDPVSGEISIKDASLFVFDINPVITAKVQVANGDTVADVNITITINAANTFTIFTGPKITFTKAGFANHTLAENQDRITDNVWITREDLRGLFNIKIENGYQSTSPTDTEWAEGTTEDIENLVFTSWEVAVDKPPSSVGKDYVIHLITDDVYIDVKILSWAGGRPGGGGFSYERSTRSASD